MPERRSVHLDQAEIGKKEAGEGAAKLAADNLDRRLGRARWNGRSSDEQRPGAGAGPAAHTPDLAAAHSCHSHYSADTQERTASTGVVDPAPTAQAGQVETTDTDSAAAATADPAANSFHWNIEDPAVAVDIEHYCGMAGPLAHYCCYILDQAQHRTLDSVHGHTPAEVAAAHTGPAVAEDMGVGWCGAWRSGAQRSSRTRGCDRRRHQVAAGPSDAPSRLDITSSQADRRQKRNEARDRSASSECSVSKRRRPSSSTVAFFALDSWSTLSCFTLSVTSLVLSNLSST